MTTTPNTGDLDLARIALSSDDFIEGHIGLSAEEHEGDAAPSEPGIVSVRLNGEVAEVLLAARGWKRGENGAWYAPDGDSMHWGRDEALTLALTAEAL
jgi:hypothetical protein